MACQTEDNIEGYVPAFLDVLSTVAVDGADSVVVIHGSAYVCSGASGLSGVNVGDPLVPGAASQALPNTCADLFEYQGWLWWLGPDVGLQIRNVGSAEIRGSTPLEDSAEPIVMVPGPSSNMAWTVGHDDDAAVVTGYDLRSPAELSPWPTTRLEGFAPTEMATDLDAVYLADPDGQLVVLSTSRLEPLATIDAAGLGSGGALAVAGDTLFVARSSGGLELIDVSEMAAPVSLGAVAAVTAGDVSAVYASGDRLYVGASDGLWILDISNPSAPTTVSGSPTAIGGSGEVADIYVTAGIAYITDTLDGRLTLVDVDEG